jgi:hypothetical protein
MNKKIIVTVLVLLLLGVSAFLILTPNESSVTPAENLGTEFPDGGTNSTQNSEDDSLPNTDNDTLILNTASGATLSVRNFLDDADTVADPHNKGYFHLGEHFSFDGTPPVVYPRFTIMYIEETQYFNISLTSEPISAARTDAEQYLLTHLGVNPEQLCQIDYMVSVPYFVNQFYTSQDLRFSFCPGSVPL